jgi:phage shock protein C
MKKLQILLEEQAFGVCTKLGERLNIPTFSIRVFFIYASFLTFGSPVIIYFALAFFINIKKHCRRRHSIWYN